MSKFCECTIDKGKYAQNCRNIHGVVKFENVKTLGCY